MPKVLTRGAPSAARREVLLAGASIASVAYAVPETRVANREIAARLGVNPGWIVARTGIHERHVLGRGERLSELAARAGKRAIAFSGVDPQALDLLLVATVTPDEIMPNAAPVVAHLLGATEAAAMDIGAACTGFLAALHLATAALEGRRARTALVIGADALSRYTNPNDRSTAALFGDGAGAMVLTAAPAPGCVESLVLGADGGLRDLVSLERSGSPIRMRGHDTYRHAVARLVSATRTAAGQAGIGLNEIDCFAFHQANGRILKAVGERLGAPASRILDCVGQFGNTSAASIPIALGRASAEGSLVSGHRVLVAACGAGFTWGAGVIRWGRT